MTQLLSICKIFRKIKYVPIHLNRKLKRNNIGMKRAFKVRVDNQDKIHTFLLER